MLAKLVHSGGINAISRQMGVSHASVLSTARVLMPGLLDGLRNYPGGVAALLAVFAESGGDRLAAAIMEAGQIDTTPGEAIIAQIGGIALPGQADREDGGALRLELAPLLAMLMVGYLSARATAGNMSNDEVAALLVDDGPSGEAPDEQV